MKKVQCELCPRSCTLEEGGRGDCRVRVNKCGKMVTLVYGNPCAVHIDPIEKKPMNHFFPGSKAFSIATAGCNLHCKFCQNWEISQRPPEETRNVGMPPEVVVSEAVINDCRSIAYTYSEPTIFYEYTLDTSKLARQKGIYNIWVTAGYINQEPLIRACEYMDGANVDIKGNDAYYRSVCSGELRPVQETIKTMWNRGVIVELTNLIVPTLNDKLSDVKELVKWLLGEIGPEVPFHFSRFTPMYKLDHLYPTPEETLFDAADMAKDMGMYYVYVGNVPPNKWEDTHCPTCKKVVVKRRGYNVDEISIVGGKCKFCGRKIYGRWV